MIKIDKRLYSYTKGSLFEDWTWLLEPVFFNFRCYFCSENTSKSPFDDSLLAIIVSNEKQGVFFKKNIS